MADTLTFTIQPNEPGLLSLSAFMRSVERVRAFVESVDYAVSGEPHISWLLVGLHSSAPTVSIAPPPSHDPRASLEAITNGLRALTRGEASEPPDHFSEDALERLRSMRPLFGPKRAGRTPIRSADYIKRIDFAMNGLGMTAVDAKIEASIDRILRGSYSARGSIQGKMERVNLRGRYSFTIWDRVSGLPVRGSFPKDPTWVERVRHLLGKRVLAQGTIHYFSNGRPRYVDVQSVIDRTPKPDMPEAYFGCIPNLTGGLETDEYLRRLREGTLGES